MSALKEKRDMRRAASQDVQEHCRHLHQMITDEETGEQGQLTTGWKASMISVIWWTGSRLQGAEMLVAGGGPTIWVT